MQPRMQLFPSLAPPGVPSHQCTAAEKRIVLAELVPATCRPSGRVRQQLDRLICDESHKIRT